MGTFVSILIGTIAGGRAPNVIPDKARAEIMIRLVADAGPIRAAISQAAAGRVEASEVMCIPAIRLNSLADLWSRSPPTFRPSGRPGESPI